MTNLQFALFFAAILIAYALVHVRLARFERHLQEIAGLKQLNERLKGVSDVLERVRLNRIEEQLAQLHEDLVALREHERAPQEPPPRPASRPAADATPIAERIRAAVESKLAALGYTDTRVLTDLGDATLDADTIVRVECSKQNMVAKGRVTTRNAAVVDVDLKPIAQVFP